jgi:hypothetical protein
MSFAMNSLARLDNNLPLSRNCLLVIGARIFALALLWLMNQGGGELSLNPISPPVL